MVCGKVLTEREERRIEMKKILDVLTEEMGKAFEAAGAASNPV